MVRYHHTQVGWLMIYLLGGVAVIASAATALAQVPSPVNVVVPLVLAVCCLLFATLTIQVTDERLRWWFGPGLIRGAIPLRDIQSAEPTRTTVLSGWGVHWTPFGWVYNVSGFGAVLVHRRRGRGPFLGTDEPERLAAAINEAVGSQAAA